MKLKKLFILLFGIVSSASYAASLNSTNNIELKNQPGFFRFSYDNLKMPNGMQNLGLLGVNYFADITPSIYAGVGGYGSVTGTQGGLFVLGLGAGVHHEFFKHWMADAGLYLGGGGGRSSLVGGGFMIRPHIGIAYEFPCARLGIHYSYIDFTTGKIRSGQLGADLDIPFDFYYAPYQYQNSIFTLNNIFAPCGKFLGLMRNDFSILLQAYKQKSGTTNVNGQLQDGTIGLVGAELDHYITQRLFWSLKAAGAYRGVPNGYMDVLAGLGYHWPVGSWGFALVPQFKLGAGGGGNVDTGGGILIQPQLGLEIPLSSLFAARIDGGYLYAPRGKLSAITATGEIIYHLDFATAGNPFIANLPCYFRAQNWRIHLLNQTYLHPQRTNWATNSAINLVAVQIDQVINQYLFLSYQAASAYSGNHAGGLATGMIGGGVQTAEFFNNRAQLFGELLIGAAGGGNLAVSGGSVIEPYAGIHYSVTDTLGLVAGIGELKALQSNLLTPVVNIGLTVRFGTLNRN